MRDWASEAMGWLAFAEQQVASLLKLIGQDNEIVTLGAMLLVALIALALVWALLLALLRGAVVLFGGGREEAPARFDLRHEGFGFAASPASAEPGKLDIVPGAVASQAPHIKTAPAEPKPEPQTGLAPQRSRSATRLSQAAGGNGAGALAISPAGELRQVQLKQMPQLADRGCVVSARPEWTGKVVPSSLQEAGAVEVCRVLSRRAPSLAGSEAVRAVDYRVCGLPRVNGEGRRQPDILVYTVADRGFLPKSAPAKQSRR